VKFGVKILQDIAADMDAEERAGRKAVSRAMGTVSDATKADWRRQVEAAGMGSRLARTIRSQVYPRIPSSNAAGMVWTRAPQIIAAFEQGVTIKSQNGFFLAIPTPAAGAKGLGGKRITPRGWEQRTGISLRFVYRQGRPSMLVADNARLNTRGQAALNRRKARKDGTQTGSMTVPIFILLPQVRLKKRFQLIAAALKRGETLPYEIVREWREGGYL
jgi:hypothetical protein